MLKQVEKEHRDHYTFEITNEKIVKELFYGRRPIVSLTFRNGAFDEMFINNHQDEPKGADYLELILAISQKVKEIESSL